MFENDRMWDPEFLRRTLAEQATDTARLMAAFSTALPSGPAAPEALLEPLIEGYRKLFMPPGLALGGDAAGKTGAAFIRAQQAMHRFALEVNGIALEAGKRLGEALVQTGPEAPPITTLRELHELWIDCGEAAYAAAAHRREFADAQAELLVAMVELRAGLASP
jgi:hypothetical protein